MSAHESRVDKGRTVCSLDGIPCSQENQRSTTTTRNRTAGWDGQEDWEKRFSLSFYKNRFYHHSRSSWRGKSQRVKGGMKLVIHAGSKRDKEKSGPVVRGKTSREGKRQP